MIVLEITSCDSCHLGKFDLIRGRDGQYRCLSCHYGPDFAVRPALMFTKVKRLKRPDLEFYDRGLPRDER